MKPINLHLVSDSTGETVTAVARAAISQFDGAEPTEHIWSLVRTKSQMERVIASLDAHPGMVLYTLVDAELRDLLKQACIARALPCIPVLAQVIAEMSDYLKLELSSLPGRQHLLSDQYFSRIEAIDFTLAHDDGQSTYDLNEADIVLVGVSRTSKSPTCVYLAHRGFKAANIPYVHNVPLPPELMTATRPLIVGLTIQSDRLVDIRKSRLQSLKEKHHTGYVDTEAVNAEIVEARKFYRRQGWPVIDVTRRSIEETVATIIQYYYQRGGSGGIS
jgi:[pyruvate, water dikinase]-phosphate phosphotransferase / [pyruvate, water dikinase] kinase